MAALLLHCCPCISGSSEITSTTALKIHRGDPPRYKCRRSAAQCLTYMLPSVKDRMPPDENTSNHNVSILCFSYPHQLRGNGLKHMTGDSIPKSLPSPRIRRRRAFSLGSFVSIRSVYELEPDDSGRCKDDAALHRRTIYDRQAWTQHTSSLRHAKTILSMRKSKVISALWPPVSVLTLVAMALALYNDIVTRWCPFWFPVLHMHPLPFQLLAPALGLLLVFRTNASYARFDEARKAWGSNMSRTRDIARQALCYIRHPSDSENVKKFLRHCIAFSYCMKYHMLREGSLKNDLSYLLEEDEMEALLAAPHQPNFCLMVMSEIIHGCDITGEERTLMSHNITQFFDNLGTCERIFKTPIPLSYTRLTSRVLVIWHVALPLVLWDSCHWAIVPATALSAAVLFCIEEVGVLIEEPFQIFPLEILCIAASKNIDNLVRIHENFASGKKSFESDTVDENGCDKAI